MCNSLLSPFDPVAFQVLVALGAAAFQILLLTPPEIFLTLICIF
jgi:hypothetical protein